MKKNLNKAIQKVVSLFLVFMFLVGVMPLEMGAYAAPIATLNETDASFIVTDEWASPGSTVSVNLQIKNNPGILNAVLTLSFDEALTLVEVTAGEALSTLDFTPPGKVEGAYSSPCNMLWDALEDADQSNGTAVTLVFEVSEEAVPGTEYSVNIEYAPGDIVDGDLNPVDFNMVGGTIEIIDYLPGDVDGNGRVNGTDVTLLRRFITGGYGTEINIHAADVNRDERINGTDVTLLRRYITGGYGVILKPSPNICIHSLTGTEANGATCTKDGNIAYWTCSICSRLYRDKFGATEVKPADTVIAATGHTVVIDEAVEPEIGKTGLTEGSHCSVCDEVIVAQEEIPVLQPNHHSITYKNLKTAATPSETSYAENTGLINLPEVSVPGYKFLGWYDSSVGGNVVDYIPAGSTKDYVLFARWEMEEYTITYKDAPKNDNPTTYTIEDEIVLSVPQWSGLAFVNWTDEKGNVITKIEEGTYDNLVITANWSTYRNRVVEKENSNLLTEYDEATGMYYFIYELGMISGVVIDSIAETYKKTTDADFTMSISQTVSVEKSISETVATMISHSVTASKEHEEIRGGSDSHTSGWHINGESKTEFDIKVVHETITVNGGYNSSNTVETNWSDADVTTNATTDEMTTEHTSAVSYLTQMSTTSETSISIPGTMPNGTYAYVHASDIRVFAVVTYDVASDIYYLDTYSIMDNMYTLLMYYAAEYDREGNCDSLSYDIPTVEINEIIANSYYVQYNPNGGGTDDENKKMLDSVHQIDVASNLSANEFTKSGYTFAGWGLEPDGAALYPDEAEVINLAENKKTITLYAIWTPNTYTVTFDANGGYLDPSEVTREYIYGSTYGKLPAPSRDGYECLGWVYNDEDVYVDSSSQLRTPNNHTLGAKWKPITYNVYYHSNGADYYWDGSVLSTDIDVYTSTYNCVDGGTILNGDWTESAQGFYKPGYTFLGWSTEPNEKDPSPLYAPGTTTLYGKTGDIHLYAVWLDTQYSLATYGYLARVTDDESVYFTYYLSDQLDMARIQQYCTSCRISVYMTIEEIDKGYQQFKIWAYSNSGELTIVYPLEDIEIGDGSITTEEVNRYGYCTPAQAANRIEIILGAKGGLSDDWWCRDLHVIATFS